MKLPFYSVAVVAMCLLFACNNGAGKDYDTKDVTLSNVQQEKNQDVQFTAPPPPPAVQEEKPENLSRQFEFVAADTVAEVAGAPNPGVLQAGGPAYADWEKKIIKTANVRLELKDYASFNTGIHDKLKRFGAYIAGEQQTESDSRIQNSLTIKVPVAQFEDLMNSIGGDGVKLLEKSISTDDVTGEVVDTKARIAAKQQVRDRYMELLKSAKTMKDILAVQEEINGIQEELEAASGRVAYLSHSAAYSTIHLTYYQYLNGNTADTTEPTFLLKVKEAFATGGTIITNILLFLISVWPLVLAGVAFIVYVKKGRLRRA